MTRRLIPASCYESLVLSEAAIGGVRWDRESFLDLYSPPAASVCRDCLWDLDFFARGEIPTQYPAEHGRPATVAEVVRALGERGR